MHRRVWGVPCRGGGEKKRIQRGGVEVEQWDTVVIWVTLQFPCSSSGTSVDSSAWGCSTTLWASSSFSWEPHPWAYVVHINALWLPCQKSCRGCFCGDVSFPWVSTYCLAHGFCHWCGCFVALHLGSSFSAVVPLSVCCLLPWLVSAHPVFPSKGC